MSIRHCIFDHLGLAGEKPGGFALGLGDDPQAQPGAHAAPFHGQEGDVGLARQPPGALVRAHRLEVEPKTRTGKS